ncbi:hypothetical protein VTL71DRAFT_15879 [Oculimacula yallundae]|uniref:Uncharacterized protein n=1 Tax=Oculimacula yallundae TaxID=86028 RepID=A0ABR4CCV9_9HELO
MSNNQANNRGGAPEQGERVGRGGDRRVSAGLGPITGTGNSDQPWGLMGDTRPPTPSEGTPQLYRRVGLGDQQQTRTYDNGTSLTFGPNDPVPEPIPGGSFDQQFLEVNAAVRDLQVTNAQGPTSTSANANNAPYDSFRTSFPPPQQLRNVQYPDGTRYYVVPSRLASVEVLPHVRSLVRHSSDQPGLANPGNTANTRFAGQRQHLDQSNVPRGFGDIENRQDDAPGYGGTSGPRPYNPNVTNQFGDIQRGPAPPPLIHPPGGQLFTLPPLAQPFTGAPLVDRRSSAPQPETARFEDSGLSKVLREHDEKREKK